MTDAQKIQEWVAFFKASPSGYETNALLAVLENDGQKMLASVLSALGLASTSDLIKHMKARS